MNRHTDDNLDRTARELHEEICQLPAIDCHEHLRYGHMYDKSRCIEGTFPFRGDLSTILLAPYVAFCMPTQFRKPQFWDPDPIETTQQRQAIIDALPQIKRNSPSIYRANLTLLFRHLYEYDIDQLSLDDWDELDARIRNNYRNGPWQWHRNICDRLHIERIVKINVSPGYFDTWLPTLSDADRAIEQASFVASLNIDLFMQFRPGVDSVADQGFARFAAPRGGAHGTFGGYRDMVRAALQAYADTPAVAYKTGMVGYRDFIDPPVAPDRGDQLHGADWEDADARRDWHSLMFGIVAEEAGRAGMPLGIHSGFDREECAVKGLEPTIANTPGTTFVIIHAGFPRYEQTAELAQRYTNVQVDLTWAPVIDYPLAVEGYEYLFATVPHDRLTVGADAHYPDTLYGLWAVHREAIAAALGRLVDHQGWSRHHAIDVARRTLYENAKRLYGLD